MTTFNSSLSMQLPGPADDREYNVETGEAWDSLEQFFEKIPDRRRYQTQIIKLKNGEWYELQGGVNQNNSVRVDAKAAEELAQNAIPKTDKNAVNGVPNISDVALRTTISEIRGFTGPLKSNIFYTTDTSKEGTWQLVAGSFNQSDDNTGTFLVDQIGRGYKRVFSDIVNVDWFDVVGDGVTIDSVGVQKAVNASQGKTLEFSKQKTYLIYAIFLPLGGITLRGNNCKIIPYTANYDVTNSGVFISNVIRNDINTGLYTGIQQPATDNNKKIVQKTIVEGFKYDAKYSRVALLIVLTLNDNIIGNSFIFRNNTAKNIVVNRVVIFEATQKITNTSGYINEAIVIDNTFENMGYFLRCVVNQAYPIGATQLEVRSLDSEIPMAEKVQNRCIYSDSYSRRGSCIWTRRELG